MLVICESTASFDCLRSALRILVVAFTKPGWQYPHCGTAAAIHASLTAVATSPDRPSMVVMVLPAASPAMTEQERAASPSISTVQAPHHAWPQPNLVPVSFSSSRKAQSSGVCGSTSRWRGWPLTFNVIMIALRSGGAHSAAGRPNFHLLDEIFVRQRDWIPASAGIPAPQYQMFGLHVLDQRLRRSVSIAYRILEHPAQVARRQTFPQHRDRRELPVQRARHARKLVVAAVVVTPVASHRTGTHIVGAANDRGDVNPAFVALQRRGQLMAVQASGMPEHVRNFAPGGKTVALLGGRRLSPGNAAEHSRRHQKGQEPVQRH